MSNAEQLPEMVEMIVSKTDFRPWLTAFSDRFKLVGPVIQPDGPPVFQQIAPESEILLDNSRWAMSPKEHLAPRYETLFVLDPGSDGQPQLTSAVPDTEPTLMVGLKPCDLRSLTVLDRVYLDGRFSDPYYAARRQKMVTLAVACDSKRWNCFCFQIGDPIEWLAAADIVLTDIGDDYLVTAFSESGAEMLDGGPVTKAGAEEITKRDVVWNALRFGTEPLEAEKVAEAVDWNEPAWEQVAEKCVGCGICSFVCPTCTCFDIQDETIVGGKVERYRVRDTCQFCDFTKMGAGHNPRQGKKERVRQRISHKFKYIVQQCNICGCVGCGRCVELCPAGTDLRKVIAEVAKGDRTESVSA